jgi:ATP-binding cassette subfamily B protein
MLTGKVNNQGLLYLARFLRPYKSNLFFVFIALSCSALSVLAIGFAIRFLIDSGFAQSDAHLLNQAVSIVLLIVVILSVASFFRSYLIESICEKVITDIRRAVYKKLIYVSPSFYELQKTSDIVSRLTNDTTLIHSVIANVFSFFLRNMIMSIGGMIMLFITSVKLTIYVIAILPVVIIPIIMIGKNVRRLSKSVQEKVGLISAHIEETMNGIKTVQCYTRESYEIDRFGVVANSALNTALSRIRIRSFLVGLVIFTIAATVTYVFWIGGRSVLAGEISSGSLASFVFYAIIVASSIGGLSEVITDFSKAAGAADRVSALLFVTSDVVESSKRKSFSSKKGFDIKFKDVQFNYPSRPELSVLNKLSLMVKAGQKVAVVGSSGAGKSTIFQLLLRFYDYNSGKIMIGDCDIKDLSLHDLRKRIALVTQEPVIFSASAYDNILYGNPDATENQVIAAAKLAEIYDFLISLPQGINSFLGEKGVRLSGGQKQRISIARAILKDPEILLLDEATNSLDSQNEALVQKSLSKFMKDRTAIIIAHRLTTIVNVDLILVLNNGKIVESGTHKELLAQSGLYAQLISKYNDC